MGGQFGVRGKVTGKAAVPPKILMELLDPNITFMCCPLNNLRFDVRTIINPTEAWYCSRSMHAHAI